MYYEMTVEIGQKYGVTKWPVLPDGVGGFQAGDLISVKIPEPIEFLVDNTSKHPPTDFVTNFMPVLSDRLVEAFRKAGVDNFQTYKAVLKNPATGETWSSYQVINILGVIACADMENSEYDVIMGDLCEFDELVIDVKKANGALFFRLLEAPGKIIVHYDILVAHMYSKENLPLFDGLYFDPIRSSHNIKK